MQRKMTAVVTLVALLATATAAEAKSVKMTGSAEGDTNSSIKLKVKVAKSGEPKKLKSIKVRGVDTFVYDVNTGTLGEPCEGEVSGKFKKFNFARGPAPSVYSWSGTIEAGSTTYQTRGAMPYTNPKSANGNVGYVVEDTSTICQSRDFQLKSGGGGGGGGGHGPKPHAI